MLGMSSSTLAYMKRSKTRTSQNVKQKQLTNDVFDKCLYLETMQD